MVWSGKRLIRLVRGDCLRALPLLADGCIDLVVTDPPYFLVNESGSGFMDREWESLRKDRVCDILCKSKEVVDIVERFLLLVQVEKNGAEGNIVREGVNTRPSEPECPCLSVASAARHSEDTEVPSRAEMCSAQGVVLTKGEVLDVFRCAFSGRETSRIEKLHEDALFAIPATYIARRAKNTVLGDALKLPMEKICGAGEILLTLTEEARIEGVTEATIGKWLGGDAMSETTAPAGCAANGAAGRRYRRITSNATNLREITRYLTWLLYASSATPKSRRDWLRSIVYLFHRNWCGEVLRVLKPGGFMFVMSSPRQDSLSSLIAAVNGAGFDTHFTSLYWVKAQGLATGENISRAIDRRACKRRLTEKLGRAPTRDELRGAWAKFRPRAGINQEYALKKKAEIERGHDNMNLLYQKSGRTATEAGYQSVAEAAYLTEPATPEAKMLNGAYAGYCPRPAIELVLVCQKPLSEKNYLAQSLKWGAQRLAILDELKAELKKQGIERVEWLSERTPEVREASTPAAPSSKKPSKAGEEIAGSSRLVECRGKKLFVKQLPDGRFVIPSISEFVTVAPGVTWLDDARIPLAGEDDRKAYEFNRRGFHERMKPSNPTRPYEGGWKPGIVKVAPSNARFPTNLVAESDVLNDGKNHAVGKMNAMSKHRRETQNIYGRMTPHPAINPASSGSFSRFFDLDAWWREKLKTLPENVQRTFPCLVVSKASQREKNAGLEGGLRNRHIAVKPIKLLSYLITLGSREGDTVLDPFLGSGSTMIAALDLNRKCIGIEIEEDSVEIAKGRLGWGKPLPNVEWEYLDLSKGQDRKAERG